MGYKNKDRQRGYQAGWMSGRRSMFLKIFGPCERCGSDKNLELDHIDRKTKWTHRVWSYNTEKFAKEIGKCQILCKDCHQDKTKKEMEYLECNHSLRGADGRFKKKEVVNE